MTAGNVERGLVTILGETNVHESIVALARCAAAELKTEPGTYSLCLFVPDEHLDSFESSLVRFAGKKRASRFSTRSLFDSLQHIRSFARIIPTGVRRRIVDELSNLSQTHCITPVSAEQLDQLVGSSPNDPLAQAYIAAFVALDYQHPYWQIENVELAVSIRSIYIACFDDVPLNVQRWILARSENGVDVTLVSSDYDALNERLSQIFRTQLIKPKTAPIRLDVISEDWRSFDTLSHERQAVLEACQSDVVDTVFCSTQESRRYIELACLTIGKPCIVDPVVSVLNSLEMRLLATMLDWELDESDSALQTLLEIAGIRRDRWKAFTKANGLPRSAAAALLQATRLPSTEDAVSSQAKCLGALLVSMKFQPNTVSKLECFIEWCGTAIPLFDTGSAADIVDQAFGPGGVEMSTFRTNLWNAMEADTLGAMRVYATFDQRVGVCQNAWLSLESSSWVDQEAIVSTIRPAVSRSLIVSHHT